MQKILIVVLIVAVVALAGVLVWQNWGKAEPIVNNQQNPNSNNNTGQNCVKEGEEITVDYIGQYGKIPDDVCCSGLNPIKDPKSAAPLSEGGCSGVGSDSYICAACGNDICGLGENKCNCPQDCQ